MYKEPSLVFDKDENFYKTHLHLANEHFKITFSKTALMKLKIFLVKKFC